MIHYTGTGTTRLEIPSLYTQAPRRTQDIAKDEN